MSELKADVHRDEVVLWGGPGFHIVHYPLRHGTLFNIVAVFRTSTHAEKGDIASHRAELEHTYRDAHPAMRALIAMIDFSWRRPIGDRDPVRHWSKGRVVLLGDAAHPPLQSLAQGACMAFEDGLCLGELIHAAGGDFAAPSAASSRRGSCAPRACSLSRARSGVLPRRRHRAGRAQRDDGALGRGAPVRLPRVALRRFCAACWRQPVSVFLGSRETIATARRSYAAPDVFHSGCLAKAMVRCPVGSVKLAKVRKRVSAASVCMRRSWNREPGNGVPL